MTTTTPTTYPRLPECAPRLPGESAEAYGLRALAFCVAHDLTATVDTEGLQLADHVFGLAVSGHELAARAAVRLAEVHRQIGATLRGRQLATEAARDAALASLTAGADAGPAGGAKVPTPPAPVRPTPPPVALPAPVVPVLVPPPLPVLPAAPVVAPVPVTGPAALPASQTGISPAHGARFVIKARPVVQLTGAPAAPKVSADEWGF